MYRMRHRMLGLQKTDLELYYVIVGKSPTSQVGVKHLHAKLSAEP